METILVTGATGFLGRRLTTELLDAGYRVHALLGAPTLARTIDHRLDGVPGGVRDRPGLAAAMTRVDGVVHIGVDAEGTRNVIDGAERSGVGRVILCSPEVVLRDTGGRVADEAFLGEPAATGLSFVRVVVGTLYGPGDPSALGALVRLNLQRKLIFLPDRTCGCTFTHVDDAARAVRLAYERGRSAGSYLLGGEPARIARFFDVLSAQIGVPAPRFSVPRWLERLLVFADPRVGQPIAELHVRLGRGVTRYFSSAKAQRELGCSFRSLADGLAAALPCLRRPPAGVATAVARRPVVTSRRLELPLPVPPRKD